jgi:hypothetical protein
MSEFRTTDSNHEAIHELAHAAEDENSTAHTPHDLMLSASEASAF